MNIESILSDHNPWWRDPKSQPAAEYPFRRKVDLLRSRPVDDQRAVLLVGPRQVGKTVLLKQGIRQLLQGGWPPGNVTYFDFSDDRLPAGGVSPRTVVEVVPPGCELARPRWFFLDEISRATRWDAWLKQSVDRHPTHRIIATDSAATLLRDGSRESGYGRVEEMRVEGLTFEEFLGMSALSGESLDDTERRLPGGGLQRFLELGGFPKHVFHEPGPVREQIRDDIANRAIRTDMLLADIDIPRATNLFVYLLEASGGVFSAQKMALNLHQEGETGPDRRSVDAWVARLETTHLLCRLDPFSHQAAGKLGGRRRSKIYAADHGLIIAFSSSPDPMNDPDVKGRVTEAAVFRAIRSTSAKAVSYLNEERGEKDFIVDLGRRRTVVEVTTGRNVSDKQAGLPGLVKRVHANQGLIVYGGLTEKLDHQVRLVPLGMFLRSPERWLAEEPE